MGGACDAGFTHLHTASGFSLRYGASHPERLAERAAERGMDALALTDRDTLAGAVRFAKACAEAGVRPLFGVDLAVARAGREERPARTPAPHPGARRRLHRRVRAACRLPRPRRARGLGRAVPAGHRRPRRRSRAAQPAWGCPGALAAHGEGADRAARPRLRRRPGARRRPPRPGGTAARALAGDLRRRAAPGGRPPRPHGHRPRLAAAGRPHRSASPPSRAYGPC